MIKWLIQIIFGNFCKHDYKLEAIIPTYQTGKEEDGLPFKITRLYLCKKCGKFKSIDL